MPSYLDAGTYGIMISTDGNNFIGSPSAEITV
jgi:hypothetical protein